ncbi:sigma 54-interacting transcriptional regulator [Thermovenabulum gondwanense]|uniref:Arginine utilization regulatory protein RocR n=1 Tax=Thermovenabulum gondwanense TaxID=520767 RepID=A0A162N3P6_9FIRM|nr:sigma 54-interacting transcriptional regulator [Thermovenabulum gondwanense]KYO69169.1 Arginine utilization regulatory protein RocR [Thermovenabulum gondwanense]
MKSITLITKGKNTCEALERQLKDLIGDKVKIRSFYIDGNIKDNITDNLIVISSNIIYNEAKKYVNPECPVIIARRSLNYHEIDKLLEIPAGTDVLLVNDLLDTTLETISLLKALGIDHINYFPYYPEIKEYPKLQIAVTPGELDLIPDCVEKVIDIKTRNIDFTTLVEILKALELLDEKANLLSARYIKEIIDLIKRIKNMADLNSSMKKQLQTIINTVHDGIIAIDEQENLTVFNPIAEEIFGVCSEKMINKNLKNTSDGKKILSMLKGDYAGGEKFVKINDKYVVINSSEVKENHKSIGTVYTIKDVTEIQRLEEELRRKLRSHEHFARYTFENIAGSSEIIKETKELAKRIAKSSSPILIQGESGTGKELFAQAIHNASQRRRGPFVAVNFAALPESLLESELFGYEEGAFTGAKKGGMSGLFEQAHGGTIFLDEIGDAPLSFQVRLLRVLQEKQIRRIGSSKVIPIDVRVISATNKDLKKLIENGEFRQDLYYRLNVLPLRLPPLRERKQDILELAEIFYNDFFKGKPLIKAKDYFEKIKNVFLKYDWPGNIRELQNVVEYLVNVSPDKIPDCSILPEGLQIIEKQWFEVIEDRKKDDDAIKILQEISCANKEGRPIGRRSLSRKTGIPESRVRKIINEMIKNGLIKVNRGVKGIEILSKGIAQIKSITLN